MFGLRRRSLALALSVSSVCVGNLSVSAIDGINVDVDELLKFINLCDENGRIKAQHQKELVKNEKKKFLDYGTRDGICYFAVTKPEDLFSGPFDTATDDMLTGFDYLDLKIANAVFGYVKGLSGAFIDFLSQLRGNCDKKVNDMYSGIPANGVSWNSSSKNGYYFSLAGGFIVPFYDNCDIDKFTKVLFPSKFLGSSKYVNDYNGKKQDAIRQYIYAKFAQIAMSFGLVTYFKDTSAGDKTMSTVYAPGGGMRLFDNRAMYNYQLFNVLKFKNFTEFRYTIQYIEGFIDILIGGAGKKVYSSWVEGITKKYWGESIKFGNN